MIKALETAIEKVKALSEERRQYVAHVLEQLAAADHEVYRLSDEERGPVRVGLTDLDAGPRDLRGRVLGPPSGMKVVYAERARQDIAEIYDAIASHGRDAAQRVENLIRSTCEKSWPIFRLRR
jgi:hypothetical protein